MTYSPTLVQEKLDYGFLVLAHIVCSDQQIKAEKLQYLKELGDRSNISKETKNEIKRILAENEKCLIVDYIANETINKQRSQVMQQILTTFYEQGLFGFSEQEAIMRIASICNWSQKGVKRVIKKLELSFNRKLNLKSLKISDSISAEIEKNLVAELCNISGIIPPALEDEVDDNFISQSFLSALGFSSLERVPKFKTSDNKFVDYALRHNTKGDSFLHNKVNPYVLVELKSRNIKLAYNKSQYKATVEQLRGYLLSDNCKSAQWGIITNSKHIQLFRKHGKAIYPATSCLEMNPENIVDITRKIRNKIGNPSRALTVTVYNDKGGVGKTTTVINLAAALTRQNKKVLIIDFDPNQKDLTNSLGIKPQNQSLYSCLNDKKNLINLKETICPYRQSVEGQDLIFDVIPVDNELSQIDEDELRKMLSFYSLRKKLESLQSDYDYILIDSPPNWRYFSISAVYASDLVLVPTQHNNIYSLKNAAISIHKYITEVQEARQKRTQGFEWGAIALPIFFNNEKHISKVALKRAKNEIDIIINDVTNKHDFDLTYYFYPKYRDDSNTNIFKLRHNAYIASSSFEKIPAVYKSKDAYKSYESLIEEYFLQ